MTRYTVTGISVVQHDDKSMTVLADVSKDGTSIARISANGPSVTACQVDLERQVRGLAEAARQTVLDAAVVGQVMVDIDVDATPST